MAINVQTAIEIISNLTLDLNFEIVPIENATSRICAEEIFATSFLPKFNNSAMDGYAIIYEDKNNELKIIDTIYAKKIYTIEISVIIAVYIISKVF